jgi:hypothetical protein
MINQILLYILTVFILAIAIRVADTDSDLSEGVTKAAVAVGVGLVWPIALMALLVEIIAKFIRGLL